MAAVIIPLQNNYPDYSIRVDLSGVEFLLSMKFNTRDSAWYLDLLDETALPIAQSIKVVLGLPLLRKIADARRPAGELIAIDNNGSGVEAETVSDLGGDGSRVTLIYADGA